LPRAEPGNQGGDDLDGLEVQGVHPGGDLQRGRHARHHVGVHDRDDRDVVGVDADELARVLHVGDDVVDRHLSSRAGRGGHRDDGHRRVLGVGHPLPAAHVGELGVGDDDPDRLARVLPRTAGDRDQAVGPRLGERLDPLLHRLDRRVGHHRVVDVVREAGIVQPSGDLGGDAVRDQHAVGDHQPLGKPRLDSPPGMVAIAPRPKEDVWLRIMRCTSATLLTS